MAKKTSFADTDDIIIVSGKVIEFTCLITQEFMNTFRRVHLVPVKVLNFITWSQQFMNIF